MLKPRGVSKPGRSVMRSACAAAVPAATLLGAVEAALQLATTLPNKTRRRTWEGAMVKVESERERANERHGKERRG